MRVAPIVEGHGEVAAVRILLQRIGIELLGGLPIEVHQPIRIHRADVARTTKLLRMLDLAQLKLDQARRDQETSFILVLLDTDPDPRPPCLAAPELQRRIEEERGHLDVACVLAHKEWETWFVAAAASLGRFLDLPEEVPEQPEDAGSGKAWIRKYFRRVRYSETADQPRMTAAMDLVLCRSRSPSFDKLCRELERRAPVPGL